ncbi:hypothetical protein [Enterobacter kobei]|uniref:hypothetical protein n=1 Tax=Enterobacter kobei TaxID=208224 RepID=UPI001F47304C|nr:hypothetical protein [Enterobacter kobei]
MSTEHVDHKTIARFAEDKVNLPKVKADDFREQAKRLQNKLEGYLSDHPDFSLKRMIPSGSLAKGTALRSLNDIDWLCISAALMHHRIYVGCLTILLIDCVKHFLILALIRLNPRHTL